MTSSAETHKSEFKNVYEGLKKHYGIDVKNFAVHAYAEPDHGDKAEELFRKVAVTAAVQRRCREAIRNVMVLRDARSQALNRLLDEALKK